MPKLLLLEPNCLLNLVVTNNFGGGCPAHVLLLHGSQLIFHHFIHLNGSIRHLTHLAILSTNFVDASFVEHPKLLIFSPQFMQPIFVALSFLP